MVRLSNHIHNSKGRDMSLLQMWVRVLTMPSRHLANNQEEVGRVDR